MFIHAINVKIREGQVANRPIYLGLGGTVDGERDALGLWAREHGDGMGEVLDAGLVRNQESNGSCSPPGPRSPTGC